MAQYAGIAGTKQLVDRIGDEAMEMLKKHFKTVKEESGQEAEFSAEGGFELEGEAALDKDMNLGVAVRAKAPELGPNIPVELSVGTDGGWTTDGTVRADIKFWFRIQVSANNEELSAVRRETLTGVVDGANDVVNRLGR